MANNLSIDFQLKLDGGDPVSPALKAIQETLNSTVGSVQGRMKELNAGVKSVTNAMAEMRDIGAKSTSLSQSGADAIRRAYSSLASDLQASIKDVRQQIKEAMDEHEGFSQIADQARARGDVRSERVYRHRATAAAVTEHKLRSTEAGMTQAAGAPFEQSAGRQIVDTLKEMLGVSKAQQMTGTEAVKELMAGVRSGSASSVARGITGLTGGGPLGPSMIPLAGAGALGALGMGYFALTQDFDRGRIATQQFQSAAGQEALSGDYTRAVVRGSGLSRSSGIARVFEMGRGGAFGDAGAALRAITTYSGGNPMENIAALVQTAIGAARTGSVQGGFAQYMRQRENVAVEEYEQLIGGVSQYRDHMGMQMSDVETAVGGRSGLPGLLMRLQGGGGGNRLTREQAIRVATGLARAGVAPGGTGSEQGLGLLGERFGVSDRATEMLMLEIGMRTRRGEAGATGAAVSGQEAFLSAAGLGRRGPGVMEARRVLTEHEAEMEQRGGFFGDPGQRASIEGTMAGISAAAMPGARRLGLSPVQTEQLAGRAESNLSSQLRNEMDPRRMAVMVSLMRMGFTPADANRILSRGIENIDMSKLEGFARRRFGFRGNAGQALGQAVRGINEQLSSVLDVGISSGLEQELYGGRISSQVLTGAASPAEGEIALQAIPGAFSRRGRGQARPEDAGDTTVRQINQQRASQDAIMAESLGRLARTLDEDFAESVKQLAVVNRELADRAVEKTRDAKTKGAQDRPGAHRESRTGAQR